MSSPETGSPILGGSAVTDWLTRMSKQLSMRKVERHLFVPKEDRESAYDDSPVPIGYGQTISQPYIVACMTSLIDPKPTDRVLEIGTGSGYQAAILGELVDSVFTIEIIPELARAARQRLHALISYYARFNYSYDTRYLLTATLRRDGTSRFSPSNRWGTFPSVALAWRLSEESFLKDNPVLSNLKLRVSYGVTGQQEGIGNYNYLPVYTYSQDGAQAQFGDQWYYTYRPQAYVANLKWETTDSKNAGLDFGFFQDRLSGTVDVYTRNTKDLLATVPAAAGSNFDKTILTNVGNVSSHGIEFSLNVNPVRLKTINWDINFNMAWQKMNVENLSLVKGGEVTNTLVGPTIDSYHFQVLTEGYEPYMFYVYHQLYDKETGKPIEGAYADVNDDGEINSSDLYRYHSPAPDFIFGLSTSLRYRKWTLEMSFRANVGNYVYNGMAMNTGAWSTVSYNSYQLNNLSSSYLKTGFQSRQYLSDYYVENASFLKMDNLTIGYEVGKLADWCTLNLNAIVQNVFTYTKYDGVDPEVPNGMLLGQKKFTIAEVMYMVGFSNHSYFSKCFQAVFQKTPLLFREEEEKKRSMWDQK